MRTALLTLLLATGLGYLFLVPESKVVDFWSSSSSLNSLNKGISPWPPETGMSYPDLKLIGPDGETVSLSSFKGKVLVIEPVGMTCKACQAFSGAKELGSYGDIGFQGGTKSIEDYFPVYAKGVSLSDQRIAFIQILFYSLKMGAPTAEDARKWAKHFGFDQKPNFYVLAAPSDLLGNASYNLIPGLQLVDKDFILRYDAAGHTPRHNMWTELMPAVAEML